MIGWLKGIIVDKDSEGATINAGGVGYHVSLPLNTLASLPAKEQEVVLWIHTHVKEDELRLFGFENKQDRAVFKTLLKISGIGPKVALTVIGALGGTELADVVEGGNAARLCSIPGIGKKTADRMILELGGKLNLGSKNNMDNGQIGVYAQVESALTNLGFKAASIQKTLANLKNETISDESFGHLLKQALTLLQGK